jgi:hypothetical protein
MVLIFILRGSLIKVAVVEGAVTTPTATVTTVRIVATTVEMTTVDVGATTAVHMTHIITRTVAGTVLVVVQEVLRGEIPPEAVMMGILLMIVMTIVMGTAATIGVHVKMKDAWRPVSSGGTVDYLRLPMTLPTR